MKNFDLNACGVQELNAVEIRSIDGGTWAAFIDGFVAGSGGGDVSKSGMSGFGWYSIGYGIGVSMKQ
ncbi:hypothetical protein [Williamwhitmania taraxaci]|uniref:Uncharacterized protein n=1 Tax=Williamwhitmania taraxaci TaxID=1640674 RepID=A0A1G6SGK8_9BACT|nr:hypothetical protein [Williamwhitmania taraxaci]SDD16060.1 hypothetical protein SAMN05216323_10949 [Williamwhitmania taraxaci]